MKRPVQWSRSALDEPKHQIAVIAEDNPFAAGRVHDRIRKTAAALGDMATGRPGRVTGTYEKSVARLPYILAYEITRLATSENVAILHVIHTARDWPDEQWPE
ncbi:type II toxin-antitoxin system RelE/ParE family toxin [Asticcacaulis sp. EMRT-3]|uniref:type II toxin-antitoxin system RelE/ParE family toxin n=1 Tax=Asticcacaulis sp. EMRT-3 TaxID=3040349 RepID=UPI0024AFF5BA|nr:type II toxin-antitoxin system RelE/ParE family toxin [Asticcacaulis sp. EMRT-3]MDI7776427.1 type II toxin-antitoxin system RelE/ParE family toxin [Asticcacaulis sp. EMRT-3]